MKKFNNTAILTSKNSEAFLNFTYDTSDYWIIPQASGVSDYMLYVNGIDVNDYDFSSQYALELSQENDMTSFHVYTPSNLSFDSNVTFYFYTSQDISGSASYTVDVSILNRPYIIPSGVINAFNSENLQVKDETSYLVLRTNPKFTGNIKLIVDSSNNLYLDTFKVSDLLSNKSYRKKSVSANSVLSSDIRNNFSTLINTGDLYKVDKGQTLDVKNFKNDIKDQYITTYNYGARLLFDDLYREDNGLLAPIWINSKLPDYFAVFKLDGVYNPITYEFEPSLNNLLFDYINESEIIKSWSLKPEAPLGKYLNTHLQDLVKISAPVFISLHNPLDSCINSAGSDPNTWYGIAVDRGILTGRSETPYFFNQRINNFTDLNAFLSDGFSRHNLLCPNLLNIEFLFDDNNASDYSMSRYFGLYLAENVLYKVAYYSDSSEGNVEIISLDGRDSSVFMNSEIFDSSGNIAEEYLSRIFVLNDGENLQRITNVEQIGTTIRNSYVSKPYKNIFSVDVSLISNIRSFITLTLNNPLEQGEHLRIVNRTQNKIWEIYSANAENYSCDKYCSTSINNGYPIVYRTYFDISGDIEEQIIEINDAISRFEEYGDDYFSISGYGSNWIAIQLNENTDLSEDWVFQRIMPSTLNNLDDASSGFNNLHSAQDITFFGRYTPTADQYEIIQYDASFGPIDFEFFGNRQSIFMNFINKEQNSLYYFNGAQDILEKFQTPTLYQNTNKWYQKILNLDVSLNSYLYVKSPVGEDSDYLIMTANPINTIRNRFNAYSIQALNISLMGINPVKDIDYTVYDTQELDYTSEYNSDRLDDIETYKLLIDASSSYTFDIQGSFVIESGIGQYTQNGVSNSYEANTLFNTFDASVYFQTNTQTTITYAILDSSYSYDAYSSEVNEESVSSYRLNYDMLKYSLTVPTVNKWVSLGNNCRNNPLLFRVDGSTIFGNTVSSHFIPTPTKFSQEISYPSFKYLSSGDTAWKSYVFYDVNDVDICTGLTIKELMFQYPYVDYFSKLLYTNNNVEGIEDRTSLVYYNSYKDSLDVIITGVSLSFQLESMAKNLIDLKKYDRFRFSLISTASRNKNSKHPFEVIINENTRSILMIWYQGADELNYTTRYSSFVPGKSLLDPSDMGFVSGNESSLGYYSFAKMPFILNNSTLAKIIINVFDSQSTYDSSLAEVYTQFNRALSGLNSVYNAYDENIIIENTFFSQKSFNTFNQSVNYAYIPNSNAYNKYSINYGYKYNTNENLYLNNTTNFNTLQYLLNPALSNVMYYIIRRNNVYTSYDFANIRLMNITINSPKLFNNVYAYHGWLKPKFNDIFEFNSNEQNLIDIVNKDFTLGNTHIKKYNNIPQIWYNRVLSRTAPAIWDMGDKIDVIKDFNIFKSLWDFGYFSRDTDNKVNGYECSKELPAFFGSKLPKLPNSLTFDTWNDSTLRYEESDTQITAWFNLTESISSKFKNNLDFLINWSGLSSEDTIINNYIKDNILPYYGVNAPKIGLSFYYKIFETETLHSSYSFGFVLNEKQNFNGQIEYTSGEYYYKVIIPKTGNYSYFIKIVVEEK